MTKRDPFFDLLKFVAMFMVVYWHVMSYRPGFDLATMPSHAANFIISMNMPLFFMISGYFSRRLHESGDWKKLGHRLVTYFWPLATVSFIVLCLETIVLHEHTIAQIPLLTLKAFLFHGWFFYALAICEVGTFCAYRWGKTRYKTVSICGLGALALILMSGKIWHTANTTAMIGFYWFGLACLRAILSNKKAFACLAGISAAVVLVSQSLMENIATNGLGFYWNFINPYHFHWTQITNQLLRLLLGIAGSLVIMGLLKIALEAVAKPLSWCGETHRCSHFVSRSSLRSADMHLRRGGVLASPAEEGFATASLKYLPRLSVLSFLGTQTLAIYYLQGFVIKYASCQFLGLDAGTVYIFAWAVVVYGVCHGIAVLTKMNRLSALVFWGEGIRL